MDKKTFIFIFLAGFIVMTIWLDIHDVSIANTIAHDGFKGITWYFFTNPAYILLFFSFFVLNAEVGFSRNAIGAILFIVASDIISYPRLLSSGLPTDISILASSDGLVITNLMRYGLSYANSHFIFYRILPIALVIAAVQVMGIHNFHKYLSGGHSA